MSSVVAVSARTGAGELVGALERVCPGRVSTRAPDRVAYARDLWPRGLLGVADGDVAPHPPDAVVWPRTTDEVVEIVKIAARTKTPIVPFGAGSGVCGGALPIHGGLVIDLKRMRRMLALDADAGSATFEAGIIGDHLEHELNRRGLTMGHFPSSIMCSTYGGWLAARSAGQLSTRYGKIEDMCRALTFVDGTARVHTLDCGAAGAQDYAQTIIGSEGTLGIITQATCTVHPLPEARHFRGWSFPRVGAGAEAIRRLLQRGLRPAVVRLYDELDSLLHRNEKPHDDAAHSDDESRSAPSAIDEWVRAATRGKGGIGDWKKGAIRLALARPDLVNRIGGAILPWVQEGCLLVVGFEGDKSLAEAEAKAAAVELQRAGGKDLGPGPGERWLKHRYSVSFRMSKVFDAGAFVDTMEVATTWDKLMPLYNAVREALAPHCFVMAHFSHSYVEGCSIYFTFAARGSSRADAERRYDDIWRAGLAATTRVGATISHHHGVGLSKAPFMPEEHGEAMRIYRALKTALDPQGIMNPGKMGL